MEAKLLMEVKIWNPIYFSKFLFYFELKQEKVKYTQNLKMKTLFFLKLLFTSFRDLFFPQNMERSVKKKKKEIKTTSKLHYW